MPKLKFVGARGNIASPAIKAWQVRPTTPEDHQAIKDLGLATKVDVPLGEEFARAVMDAINNRANQLRNPSYIYDRKTARV